MSTPTIPSKQKAWVAVSGGAPAQAVILDDQASVPSDLAQGEVLVKVQAAALNPIGHKLLGWLPNLLAGRPHVVEYDFCGVVVDSTDPNTPVGLEVVGFIPIPLQQRSGQGALSQYTRVPGENVVPKPANFKATEAAGLGLVGLSAYQGLFDLAKLEPGQSVFINGGSTSVGIFAIQLAKSIGCTVTATASGKKEEFLKSLGVDKFIDYTKGPVYEQLERFPPIPKFHVILEAVGDTDITLYTRSPAYLAPGGVFVSLGPTAFKGGLSGTLEFIHFMVEIFRPRIFGGTDRTWRCVMADINNENFQQLMQYAAEGKVKGIVDSVFAFEDVHKAYERLMSNRASGKVVVKVDPNVE